MKKVVGLVIGLVPISAFAECVPVPECASIGYTETSCEGDSLKCPFDASKLRCFPCDSSFRFACSGENITGGVGNACNGKYSSCSCSSSDYVFINGKCVCDTRCNVGAIYYSDGTCNRCLIEGKTPVGVVIKDNELVFSKDATVLSWSKNNVDVPDVINYATTDEAISDYNGAANTLAIVQTLTNETAQYSAVIYCYEFAPSNMESSKNKWYLPAAGEIYKYIYQGRHAIEDTIVNKFGNSGFRNFYNYWTSTEKSASQAWMVQNYGGYVRSDYNKGYPFNVNCFLNIKS